jgi:hypothetical protein
MVKKKKFPKIVKHLKNYLTDESWKITKHNALGLWTVGAVLGGFEWAEWHHHSTGYAPGTLTRSWSPSGTVSGRTLYNNPTCNHSSGIVNGTYTENNRLPSGGSYYATHTSGAWTWSSNIPTTSTQNRTFYYDCGNFSAGTINGHYSGNPGFSASTPSVTHTSTHSNY